MSETADSFASHGDPAPACAFQDRLRAHGASPLLRGRVTTLQVNVGKLCNMACQHCHVDAGPKRTEIMPAPVAERVLELLDLNPGVELLDLTGGAPELNPSFTRLVSGARRLGRRVIDRCNLTVLAEPGMEGVPGFLAEQGVELVSSLPCYLKENVDKQRGKGAYEKSIEALRRLNTLGYGRPGSGLLLDLVYNPGGPSLPPHQPALEADYRRELGQRFGIEFNRLLTITNMPIHRFARDLERTGTREAYMSLLASRFNPGTVPGLMCRSLLSVGWEGTLFDCDFNQMLGMELGAARDGGPRTVWDAGSLDDLAEAPVATASHCLGCTAGGGSSCGGALS